MALFRTAPALQILVLAITLHATAANALLVRSCSMTRDAMAEKVNLVFDERQQLAGFAWSIVGSAEHRCLLSAETFKEAANERYRGVGGCELLTWRQGVRQTLAVANASNCRAYCTSEASLRSLELPISVDIARSRCSD